MKKCAKKQNLLQVKVLISGRVQGVFYRWHTIQKANQLGLSGWVRNRRDGRVEALIIGPQKRIQTMLNWFWQGSPASKVEKVEVVSKEAIDSDPFEGRFFRRPTC